MYAVYHDDPTKYLVGIYDTKPKALAMAHMTSKISSIPIICIFNLPSGGTAVCFRYEHGKQTFDGGCCPSAWAKSAMEVSPAKHV